MILAVVLCLLGMVIAVAAHVGTRITERRARERYRELVGEDPDVPQDGWQEVRPLAGRWGCVLTTLEFVRGLGIFLTLGAGLYVIVG